MKRIQFFAWTAFAAILLTFTACQKDPIDDLQPDTNRAYYAHVNFMRGFGFNPQGGCVPTPSMCIEEILLTTEQFKNTKPGTNEFFARPEAKALKADLAALILMGEMELSQLDDEARHQLFDEGRLLFEAETPLPDNVVRQAFENAGLKYEGQRFSIKPGAYKVEHLGGGNGELPAKIIITITISPDEITITIEWRW